MRKRSAAVLLPILLATSLFEAPRAFAGAAISLPSPDFKSNMTVEQAIHQRRSVRTYADVPLTLKQVSQLLWAAQGITDPKQGHRTAPSAMGTYPLRLYLLAGKVNGLSAGLYRYLPQGHKIELVRSGDQRAKVGWQPQMRTAPALILYAADLEATGKKFGSSIARSWAEIEVGHSAQNVLLEEQALGLVGVGMTGFDAEKARSALKLPKKEEVIYLVSAGKKG